MKNLSIRFILSNIISAVLLVWYANKWKLLGDDLSNFGRDPYYGIFIYSTVIIGIVTSAMKAYDLAYHTKNKFKWFEQIFIVLLYVLGIIGIMILMNASYQLVFPEGSFPLTVPRGIFIIFPIFIGFIALALEAHFMMHRPTKALSPQLNMIANIGSTLYSGIGVAICWNTLIIGGMVKINVMSSMIWSLPMLMLALVFPFQRLFWYEVMGEADKKLDYIKVLGGIVLVSASGILPLFFIG